MLHTYVEKFDVTGTIEKFLGTKLWQVPLLQNAGGWTGRDSKVKGRAG